MSENETNRTMANSTITKSREADENNTLSVIKANPARKKLLQDVEERQIEYPMKF